MKLSWFFLIIVAALINISIENNCRMSSDPLSDTEEEHNKELSEKSATLSLNLEQYIICENVVLSKDFHKKIHQFFDIPEILGLHITNSNSSEISAGAFSNLSMIPQLRINYAGVQTIELGAFDGLNKLSYLSLQNNSIYKIERPFFSNLQNLDHLDLSDNFISDINESAFDNLTKLEELIITGNQLLQLPKNLFRDLTNLKTLDLSNNKLIRLEKKIFANLTNLLRLALDDNDLEILDKNLFAKNTKLMYLFLGSNFLTEFDEIVLPQSLYFVTLTHNRIHTLKFVNSTKIKHLDLAHNELALLSNSTFKNLEVTFLVLSYNLIQQTNSNNVFKNIRTLEKLLLDHNKLRNLVDFPKNIEVIIANHNYLSNFEHLSHLDITDLDLRFNNITSIFYNSLDGLDNLNTLYLQHNQISTISIGSFRNLKKLTSLDLSFNNIKFIELGTFAGAAQLTGIGLSHNKINKISDGVFHNLQSLEYIIISYNNISSINFTQAASYLPNLQYVDVTGNPLSCSAVLEILEELPEVIEKGDNDKVSNVYGMPCRTEVSNNDQVPSNNETIIEHWIEKIILNQQTRTTILIFVVIVLITKILIQCFKSYFRQFYNYLTSYVRTTPRREELSMM